MVEIFKLLLPVLPLLVAIIGWIVAHYFTTNRDRQNKKREIILQHLISAYKLLANDISNRPQSKESEEKLEQIITDIQLFGTLSQIEFVKKIVKEVAAKEPFQLDSLINDLRSDLRKELGLKNVKGNVTWLRF